VSGHGPHDAIITRPAFLKIPTVQTVGIKKEENVKLKIEVQNV
jgi:hypothetical protein